jgi:hypothetical protein
LAALGCRFAVFKASQGVTAPRLSPPGPAAVSLLEFSAGAAQGLRRFSRKFFQERRVPGGAVSFKKIPHAGPSRLAWFFQKKFFHETSTPVLPASPRGGLFSRFTCQAPFPSSTFFAQAVSPGLLPPVNARSPNFTAPSPSGPLAEIYAKRIIAAHRTTREKHKCRLTKVTRYRLRKNTENTCVVKTYLSSGEFGDTQELHNIVVK